MDSKTIQNILIGGMKLKSNDNLSLMDILEMRDKLVENGQVQWFSEEQIRILNETKRMYENYVKDLEDKMTVRERELYRHLLEK